MIAQDSLFETEVCDHVAPPSRFTTPDDDLIAEYWECPKCGERTAIRLQPPRVAA